MVRGVCVYAVPRPDYVTAHTCPEKLPTGTQNATMHWVKCKRAIRNDFSVRMLFAYRLPYTYFMETNEIQYVPNHSL